MIDSQGAKTIERGGPRGYNTSKKIKRRKRHILIDTDGNLIHAVIHRGDIQSLPRRRPGIATVHRSCWPKSSAASRGWGTSSLSEDVGWRKWLILSAMSLSHWTLIKPVGA